jgi:hypothetical protein
MKAIAMVVAVIVAVSQGLNPTRTDPGISGTIDPADAVYKVVAIKDNDSTAVIPSNGKFAMNLKPGTWILTVEAISPYKNHSQSVLVLEGGPTDLGVIKLIK